MPRVVHFEFSAEDPKRAVRFYRDVFGWTFAKWEGPLEYWLITTGPDGEPGINGGVGRRTEPGEGTVNTVAVSDIDDALTRVTRGGGEVTQPKHAIPGVGWQAYCRDPEGNVFGIHQADATAR